MTAQAQQGKHPNLRLSRFVALCSDIDERDRAEGMVAAAWRSPLEADRRGAAPAIRFLDNSYRMLRKIKDQSNAPMNCTSIRAMYAKLRQDGFSPGEVEQGLPAILVDLYGER